MNLEDLKKYEPIYVIGHMNPDIDTASSSKLVSNILNSKGIKSYYAILDKNYEFNEYNKRLINDVMEYNPVVIKNEDIEKYNWFITDHNDPIQSVGYDANIVGCIDHHMNSNKVSNIYLSNICSAALTVYDLFKNEYSFNEEEKRSVFFAFLDDSKYGMSSRYKESDGLLADELGFGRNYKELFKKYFIPTDLSKGIEYVINNGYKKVKYENVLFESSFIETYGVDGLNEYKELIKEKDSFLGRWVDYENEKTYVIFKYDNKVYEKNYDFIASRATTVMNDLIEYLKENNYLQQ